MWVQIVVGLIVAVGVLYGVHRNVRGDMTSPLQEAQDKLDTAVSNLRVQIAEQSREATREFSLLRQQLSGYVPRDDLNRQLGELRSMWERREDQLRSMLVQLTKINEQLRELRRRGERSPDEES